MQIAQHQDLQITQLGSFFCWRQSQVGGKASGSSSVYDRYPEEDTVRHADNRGHGSTDCGKQSHHATGHWPSTDQLSALTRPDTSTERPSCPSVPDRVPSS